MATGVLFCVDERWCPAIDCTCAASGIFDYICTLLNRHCCCFEPYFFSYSMHASWKIRKWFFATLLTRIPFASLAVGFALIV